MTSMTSTIATPGRTALIGYGSGHQHAGQWLYVTVCPWEPELIGYRINLVDVPLDAWAVARRCVGEIATN